MPSPLAARDVVIGAGIGGLTAARAIAPFFANVLVLERDALPEEAAARPGAPQGRHLHRLLPGGLKALETLFPGFRLDLESAGATRVRCVQDFRIERPGYDPFPQRDFGYDICSLSRPLLERLCRRRLEASGIRELIDAAWASAAGFSMTKAGVDPAVQAAKIRYGASLIELMARDPSVHRLVSDVNGRLKP